MKARALLTALLLFPLVLSEVAAQPAQRPEDAARARELFERGVQLMENEDFDPALVQLQRSFELRPTQVGLFNIGLCLKALHRYQEAIAAFERLLREFATGGSEERRTLARTEIQNMRALLGSLRITVSVPGAEVLVDGSAVGISPIANPVELVGGNHVVVARREGFQPAEQRVAVVAGETATVELTLHEVAPPRPSDAPAVLAPVSDLTPDREPRDEPQPSRRGLKPVWFWSATALAGAGAIATGVLGALIVTGDADYEASDPRTFDDQADGKRLMRITDVVLGVTLAAAVGAPILYTQTDFQGGGREVEDEEEQLNLSLDSGRGRVGLVLGGGF